MNKRPHSITVIGWIFIAFGAITLLGSALPTIDPAASQRIAQLKTEHPFEHVAIYILRIFAVVCGVLMLRGSNWGRWLLVVWIAYHVILSAFHSSFELAVHGSLFAVIAYFLFRPQASAYFRGMRAPTVERHPGGQYQ